MNAVTKPESTALTTLTSKLALALDIGDGSGLAETLKATAFRSKPDNPVSDAQLTALLIVANQYGLNPWTKEIYAFPDKNNGIVPVVGVDGWSRIINKHPQFDGIEFAQDADACTCTIYRKDRSHPTSVTEYMIECKRANVQPWQTHPYRMLRHKAMIQCARLAFGFVGIYEQDEAERIVENTEPKNMGPADVVGTPPPPPAPPAAAALPEFTEESLTQRLTKIAEFYKNGKTADEIIAFYSLKATLPDAMKDRIRGLKTSTNPKDVTDATIKGEPIVSYAQLADRLHASTDAEIAALILDEARALPVDQQKDLSKIYAEKFGSKE